MGLLSSRPSRRLIVVVLLLIFLLLLTFIQYFGHTSYSHSRPLVSSRYPPSRLDLDPDHFFTQFRAFQSNFTAICPGSFNPVYPQASLTLGQQGRYAHLRHPDLLGEGLSRIEGNGKYMLVTSIRQIQAQLPDLLNTLLILTTFLGPDRLSFSILEGPSDDCTPKALELVVVPLLLSLGVPEAHIRLQTRQSKIDFDNQNRIQVLAELRNRAFEPLWDGSAIGRDISAVVVFNDVYLRASDVLELLHQHLVAGVKSGKETGITSGMDYLERWPEWYYDVWVGRTVS